MSPICAWVLFAANLADELSAAYCALAGTNKIAGVVLDLRFADGSDDTAAQAAAKLLAAKKIIAGPLAVLVNGETRGTAKALAAALRQAGAGLIIGSPTAGEAMALQGISLKQRRTAPRRGGPGGFPEGPCFHACNRISP